VLATVNTPTGHCSMSIKRVVLSRSAPIAELYASPGPHMFVVTVAVRRHMLKEVVHKREILRVSFSRDI
jgi:hypothetical protein